MKTSPFVSLSFAELYFEVKVNASITGDADPERTLCTWVRLAEQLSSYFYIQEAILASPGLNMKVEKKMLRAEATQ